MINIKDRESDREQNERRECILLEFRSLNFYVSRQIFTLVTKL